MLSNCFYWFSLLIICYILFLIIEPLVILLRIKAKHGNDVKIVYFPLFGMIYYLILGERKYKDAQYLRKNFIKENPNYKVINYSSCYLLRLVLSI